MSDTTSDIGDRMLNTTEAAVLGVLVTLDAMIRNAGTHIGQQPGDGIYELLMTMARRHGVDLEG